MRNVMKTATLESKFPLLAVENGCIISKDADITVAYRVELPELFTLTRAEYESMHSTWAKAVRSAELQHRTQAGLLRRGGIQAGYLQGRPELSEPQFRAAFQRAALLAAHLLPVPDEDHEEHSRTTSSFNALTRGFIIPREMQDKETVTRFIGVLRTIRAYRERQRPAPHHPPDG